MNTILLASTLITHFEGLSLIPYLCPAQYWTIGYGSSTLADGTPVRKDSPPISQEEACVLLERHLLALQRDLRSFVTAPLTEAQEAALLSWQYNIGTGAARGSSLVRLLNEGRYAAAALQFVRWNKATLNGKLTILPGLVRRREIERDVFLGLEVPGFTGMAQEQPPLTMESVP